MGIRETSGPNYYCFTNVPGISEYQALNSKHHLTTLGSLPICFEWRDVTISGRNFAPATNQTSNKRGDAEGIGRLMGLAGLARNSCQLFILHAPYLVFWGRDVTFWAEEIVTAIIRMLICK